ncbi:MAG TPA: DNA topoisomerase IV subunit A [Rectinema sp.]|nr:DNA topoisomerase IV subunit A [Spirochaetia bacterium]HOO01783.1 DNA topoisomerase IV subunit A [Rectinema sp.]HQC17574.1 DNA topoisomerase IV subunit A [Rectinema sp.]
MAYINKLLTENFLYYASYVIMDRAIPELDDGLKPVQRRILHSLFEMDDGKFHKVANVVGHCMKYHPHGDASIASALINLANRGLFLDTQGNFGNPITGDEASAPRYIECKCSPFAKEIFYHPKITRYIDSYDGRNKEPLVFPAKIPVILILGAEGIAVGMSTRILPHNPIEVIKAEIAYLQGKAFSLSPDFPAGGTADCSEYADGNGKVRVRATIDSSDPKKIVIKEIPYGSTTESLINSIEEAVRAGHLKIASISDFTTSKVEIELKLARGVYARDVVDALYAFTECERSISCNCLVIKEGKPVVTTVSETIKYHAARLLDLLRQELELERDELKNELFSRTLERIFIEEKIYTSIETKRTNDTVIKAVLDGLKPFTKELSRKVEVEDVERLLKIPIRRISLYDIEKAKREMEQIERRISENEMHLRHIVDYAIDILQSYIEMIEKTCPRKTKLRAFKRIEARAVARHDFALKYDAEGGYLGTEVSGEKLLEASKFDKILILRNNGIYTIIPLPDKFFAGQKLLWTAIAKKESLSKTTITLIYSLSGENGAYIKRTIIDSWLTGRDYSLLPETAVILGFSTASEFDFKLEYKPKSRSKKTYEVFHAKNYTVRNRSAQGIKLTDREIIRFEILTTQESDNKRKQEDLDASTAHISKKKPNREARSKKEIPPLETISEGLLKAALKKQKKEN